MTFLSIIGALYTSYLLYRFTSFLSLYFFSSYSLDDYLTGESPYAIVTGASDGIGKGIATELYRRGFNLILHGRNEEKTRRVADEIRALRSGISDRDQKDIRIFLTDATKSDQDFHNLLAPFKDFNISILVNNVGGSSRMGRLDEWSITEITESINWNIFFPLGLTHTLLPQLRKRPGKCLVVNVGSIAGDLPAPRLAIYSSVKSFIKTLTWGLSVDERYFTPTNTRFIYLNVGQVQSNALRQPVTFLRPSSERFGKEVVDRIACGRLVVVPYVVHAVTHWFITSLGPIGEWLIAHMTKRLFLLKDKNE